MFGKRIENRILAGITSFVAIMVLVGWVAINEGGRMQAFEQEFNARSIERGAALFATNCTTCHGADARGILGRAPGLNNPQLFGHNFVGQFEDQIDTLTQEMKRLQEELAAGTASEEQIAEINTRLGTGSIAAAQFAAAQAAAEATAEPTSNAAAAPANTSAATPATTPVAATSGAETTATPSVQEAVETAAEAVTGEQPGLEAQVTAAIETLLSPEQQALRGEQQALEAEKATLQTELGAEGISEERTNEINARLAEINTRLGVDTIPYLLTTLEQQRQQIIDSMGPAVEKGYDPANFNRLSQLSWPGSLNAFIYTTLIHGRPVSGLYWPSHQSMPAWSQTAGGPLRNDQLQDLTTYILNFDKGDNWTLEDLFAVNQFAITPGGGEPAVEGVAPTPPTPEQILTITNEMMTLTGDPQNGQTLYNSGRLACAGCHVSNGGVIAPHLEGTWTRVQEVRLADPRFAGYTGEHYLVESILRPDLYTVPPYAGVMPTDFGNRLNMQMLADIVAYLKSQDGPSPE